MLASNADLPQAYQEVATFLGLKEDTENMLGRMLDTVAANANDDVWLRDQMAARVEELQRLVREGEELLPAVHVDSAGYMDDVLLWKQRVKEEQLLPRERQEALEFAAYRSAYHAEHGHNPMPLWWPLVCNWPRPGCVAGTETPQAKRAPPEFDVAAVSARIKDGSISCLTEADMRHVQQSGTAS